MDGPVPYSWPVPTKASRELGLLDAALWAASFALFVLSIAFSWGAPPHLGPQFDWSDKAWHFLGYGALCGTLLLAAVWRPGRGSGRFPRAAAGVTLLVLALAWATEALQVPFGRDADPTDALADLAGIAVASALHHLAASSALGRLRGRHEPNRMDGCDHDPERQGEESSNSGDPGLEDVLDKAPNQSPEEPSSQDSTQARLAGKPERNDRGPE